MTQPDRAPARFAADRKRFFQQVVERFAGGEPFTEEDRLIAQIVVAHGLIRRLQLVDSGDARLDPLKFALVGRPEHRRYAILYPSGNRTEKIAYSV